MYDIIFMQSVQIVFNIVYGCCTPTFQICFNQFSYCKRDQYDIFRVELNADAREVNGELYCLRCHDKMGIPICGACR